MSPRRNNILYVIWRCVTFLFYMYKLAAQYCNAVKIYLISAAFGNCKFSHILTKVKQLPKVPKHVAFAFQYPSGGSVPKYLEHNNAECYPLDLQQISKVTAWMAAAGVDAITLYDRQGILKTRLASLKYELSLAVEDAMKSLDPNYAHAFPDIIWHCVIPGEKCSEITYTKTWASEHLQPRRKLNIFICSYDDGKPKLLDMVRKATSVNPNNNPKDDRESNNNLEASVSKIDVHSVNEYLKRKCCHFLEENGYQMEPDLLISFGDTQSTLGFLPWHIRLTELHWLPQVSRIHPMQVLDILNKYAKCEQRFGK